MGQRFDRSRHVCDFESSSNRFRPLEYNRCRLLPKRKKVSEIVRYHSLYRAWMNPLSSSSLMNRMSTKSVGRASLLLSPSESKTALMPSKEGYWFRGSLSSVTDTS